METSGQRLAPGISHPHTRGRGKWVDSRARLNIFTKTKILVPAKIVQAAA